MIIVLFTQRAIFRLKQKISYAEYTDICKDVPKVSKKTYLSLVFITQSSGQVNPNRRVTFMKLKEFSVFITF